MVGHDTQVQKDYEKLGSDVRKSSVKLSRGICPVSKHQHMITKDDDDEFITHLKSVLGT